VKNKGQQTSTEWEIPERFKAFVDVYLNPDGPGTIVGASKEAGIDRTTVYKYFKRKEAIEYMNKRSAEIRKANDPTIHSALIRKARKGDVAAIRLYYEMFGDLKHKVQHSGEDFPKLVIEYGNGNGNKT